MWAKACIITAALFSTACATALRSPAEPNIYVIRHLHTPAGVQDPDLTDEGRHFAKVLADRLTIDPPQLIFVSNTKRAFQTAEPLARWLGVTPTTYDPSDTPGLVATALQASGTVLIVGHSNTVPDIVAGLGGERPAALVHEDFGDIWHIRGPERRTTHSKL